MEYARHSLHSVWLPGSNAICIEQALDLGVCTKRSHAHLIERDKPTFMKLQETIKKKKLHERANIHLHNVNLEDFVPPDPIDFAFIDLLGTFTPSVLIWLDTLAKNITTNCRLCFTHLYKNRNNHNLKELMELCQTKYKDIYNDCKDLWQYNDEWITLAAFELKCCFSEWDFVLKSPYPYRDTHWGMVVYRCEDFQRKETGLPKIEELLMQTKMGRRDIHRNRIMKAYNSFIELMQEYCEQQNVPDCTNRFPNPNEVLP